MKMRTVMELWDKLENDKDAMIAFLRDYIGDQKKIMAKQKIVIVLLSIVATAAVMTLVLRLL